MPEIKSYNMETEIIQPWRNQLYKNIEQKIHSDHQVEASKVLQSNLETNSVPSYFVPHQMQ